MPKKLVICLPTFFSPQDKRSTGGTISNYILIKELSYIAEVEIISPIVSKDLIENNIENFSVITREGLEGGSILAKARKKIWLRKEIFKKAACRNISVFISTNGTSTFVNDCSPEKHIVLTRAYEDFLSYDVKGESIKEKVRKAILNFFIGRKVRKVYSDATLVITNSMFMKRGISEYFKIDSNNIFVLYPPVDFPETGFRSLPTSERIKIGMINPKKIKGEDIFLALANEFTNIDFVYFSREDKNYQEKNVFYMGWGSDPVKMYREFDILIAPSLWNEPFGRVAVEGIRSGIPVLVSNNGGIPETVNQRFVVESNEPESWVKKISWLLNNPEDVAEAWAFSKEHTENFTTNKHVERVKTFLIPYVE